MRQFAVCVVAMAALVAGPTGAKVLCGADYVVDQRHPEAGDDNPGTAEKPFETVQKGVDAAGPGDTVHVMDGQYVERVKVAKSGAEGKPIIIRSVPRRTAKVEGFDLSGASYVRIEGFDISSPEPQVAICLGGHWCEIVDNNIHDMRVAVQGSNGQPIDDGKRRDYSAVTHNRIAYNRVYHCEYGFILGGEDWLVESNEISRLFMYSEGKRFDDCDYTRFFGKNAVQRYNYYHGTNSKETKIAHVDAIQTFAVNGEVAENLLFEHNVCFDWGQGCMASSAPNVGNIRKFTFRHNIFSSGTEAYHGAWGVNLIQVPDVTIEYNTFSAITWYGAGLRGKESTGGRIVGNLCTDVTTAIADRKEGQVEGSNPVIEHNLSFKAAPVKGDTNINDKDPLFVDAADRNFRLKAGSPAIGAGPGGATLGALPYPNVYYVDPRHPAASDGTAWGYAAVPFATVTAACRTARPGETIVLRGGVYRETIAPETDGLTIRPMAGEKVVVSGADVVGGWARVENGWSTRLPAKPDIMLRDGEPWTGCTWDADFGRLVVTDGDPRLHLIEVVRRQHGIDLGGNGKTKVEGIEVVNTLGDPIVIGR